MNFGKRISKNSNPKDGSKVKKKGKEISVKKAAQSLNLSERTVLNFIKQKKLEAIKVKFSLGI